MRSESAASHREGTRFSAPISLAVGNALDGVATLEDSEGYLHDSWPHAVKFSLLLLLLLLTPWVRA